MSWYKTSESVSPVCDGDSPQQQGEGGSWVSWVTREGFQSKHVRSRCFITHLWMITLIPIPQREPKLDFSVLSYFYTHIL